MQNAAALVSDNAARRNARAVPPVPPAQAGVAPRRSAGCRGAARLVRAAGASFEPKVEVAGPMRIGRDPEAELALMDRQVSRHHEIVACEDGAWTVSDPGSPG